MASIEKRGENTYRITVSAGYDSRGKKIRKRKIVELDPKLTDRQREKELDRLATLFEEQVANGTYLDGEKINFAEFCDIWLKDHAEKQLEDRTLFRYKEILNTRIIPALGHLKLQKLQPPHLLEFYANLQEAGIRTDTKYVLKENYADILAEKNLALKDTIIKAEINDNSISQLRNFRNVTLKTAKKLCEAAGKINNTPSMKITQLFNPVGDDKGLSEKTIKQHHAIIHSALQKAVEWQLIIANPADRVRPPKVPKKEARHMTEDQALAMLQALMTEPLKYQIMIHLDLATGMRRGELMALEWKDIDTDKRIVKVRKAMQYIPGEGQSVKSPKNETSIRDISIPKYMVSLLNEYKVQWNAEKASLGDDLWKGEDWIFTKWDGSHMHVDTISSWFPKFLKRHGLERVNFHAVRHTAATLLINQGLNIKALSARLGHADTSTTMDIYSHALKSADKKAADMMENIIAPKKKKSEKREA